MPTPSKFNQFSYDLIDGIHDFVTHSFKVALTNSAPSASNTQLSDITQIANGNGYTTGGAGVTVSTSTSSGTAKVLFSDATFTASGGTMATFRYAVLYNDTSTNDKLICWIDHGSTVSLADGNLHTFDFDGTNGLFTLV